MSDDLEPPPRPAAHSTEHASMRAAEDILNAVPEPTQAREWPEVAERGRDLDIGWGRDIEPERTPERRPEREFRPREPEAPSTRGFESEEVFDPDLPPSRTQRSRPMTERPRPIEPEPPEPGRHRPTPSFPAEREPRERIEPAIPEPDIEPFGSRDPRKGRGRGRSTAPPGRGRPSPPAGRVEPPFPSVEREPIAETPRPEPGFEDVPPLEEPPRRRGGRAAIRSSAGDWDRPRENPVPPVADVERLLEPERKRPAEPVEPIREREPERERPRDRDPVRDRERPRPHARAGEPGYIPRRERLRSGDSPFGDDLFPAETEWSEREFDPLLEEDAGTPSAEFPDEDDANLLEEEGPGAPAGHAPKDADVVDVAAVAESPSGRPENSRLPHSPRPMRASRNSKTSPPISRRQGRSPAADSPTSNPSTSSTSSTWRKSAARAPRPRRRRIHRRRADAHRGR